jgi:hypothetical protein
VRNLFLDHPWREPDGRSQVYVAAEGKIGGFIGILPVRMSLRGKPIRAAVAGSLMVEDPQRNPLAGARLLRSLLEGPQDLSISETANPVSQRMWERLGGRAVAAYSMEWVRVLRPAGLAASFLSEKFSPAKVLRPLAAIVDRLLDFTRAVSLRLPAGDPQIRSVEADESQLLNCIPEFTAGYALRPEWDRVGLGFILDHAGSKDRYGKLYRRMVYGKGGRLLGCYLFYGRPRQVAWVLQIFARNETVDAVIATLLADAYAQGCVAVRGRTQPELLDSLLRQRCVMLHRSSTVVHSRNSEVMEAIRSGDALMIGLAGESWTQLIGGIFV